jgi:hypothetical protein
MSGKGVHVGLARSAKVLGWSVFGEPRDFGELEKHAISAGWSEGRRVLFISLFF